MHASLNERGKMAVVLDIGAVSRGSGNQGSNRERDIRKAFVERDLVEAVILLPENLFYNTSAPGIILIFTKRKKQPSPILLINGAKEFLKGRPKNYLTNDHIAHITDTYLNWREIEGLSKIISNTTRRAMISICLPRAMWQVAAKKRCYLSKRHWCCWRKQRKNGQQ